MKNVFVLYHHHLVLSLEHHQALSKKETKKEQEIKRTRPQTMARKLRLLWHKNKNRNEMKKKKKNEKEKLDGNVKCV